jgi:hypothetical protein
MRELTVSELHMEARVINQLLPLGSVIVAQEALPLNDAKALHTARVMCWIEHEMLDLFGCARTESR